MKHTNNSILVGLASSCISIFGGSSITIGDLMQHLTNVTWFPNWNWSNSKLSLISESFFSQQLKCFVVLFWEANQSRIEWDMHSSCQFSLPQFQKGNTALDLDLALLGFYHLRFFLHFQAMKLEGEGSCQTSVRSVHVVFGLSHFSGLISSSVFIQVPLFPEKS